VAKSETGRMTFEQFFTTIGGNQPYRYQCRLACGEKSVQTKTTSGWNEKPITRRT
jgi:hypothetical protein